MPPPSTKPKGSKRRPSAPREGPRSILALRPGGLGDTLFAFPALRRLREAFPKARLAAAGNADFLAFAAASRFVDEVRSLETLRFWSMLSDEVPLDPDAGAYFGSFDLVVSWGYEGKTLGRRVLEAGARKFHGYPFLPPKGSGLHAARFLLGTLRDLGLEGGDPAPRVFVPLKWERAAEDAIERKGTPPILAVHPGSGGRRKNWPASRFAEVASRFARETGGTVLLLTGYADEEEREAFLEAGATGRLAARRSLIEARGRPLPEVAALLSRARAYLGNDSGVTHLAAAVGTAVVALFGASDPATFAPLGERVRVVRGEAMGAIGAEEVSAALLEATRAEPKRRATA